MSDTNPNPAPNPAPAPDAISDGAHANPGSDPTAGNKVESSYGMAPTTAGGMVGSVPQDQRTFGMLAHLAALSGFVGIPLGFILGPLVIWLIKKDTMPFVDEQGKEAMNFQITVVLAMICCIPLIFVLIGILLLPAVGITALVFTIIAAVKASNGEHYRYPFALRLIK